MNMTNKTIVITGASRGLGREIALHLSSKGANLILAARSKNLLEKTRQEIENLSGTSPRIIPCDLGKEENVNHMADIIRGKVNQIDVLINNAGIGIHKPMQEMTSEEMRRLFEVNFYGAFYCIRALLPLLRKSKSGYILNIGSLVGEMAFADNSVYAATKSALAIFTQGLAQELKPYNIRAGYFMPGLMPTSFQSDRETQGIPKFLFLDPKKVAWKIGRVLQKRRQKVYMYRWMLYLMRLRKIFT